ncbi:MAG: zinc-ribbon domain-containing protein [Eubacteriaceae bacterium]|nr:zinc-ribbon domain-containing protein [Eubacteriaceae bacterium]
MYCKNCGTQIPDNALFCPACGTRTGVSIQNTPAETPVPAAEAPAPAEEITAAVTAPAVDDLPIEKELDAILDRGETAEPSEPAEQSSPEPVADEQPAPQPEPVVTEQPEPQPEPAITEQPALQPEPAAAEQPEPQPEPAITEQPVPQPEPINPEPQPAPQSEPVRTAPQAAPSYSQTSYQSSYQNKAETSYQSSYNQGVTPVKVAKKKKSWIAVVIILLLLAIGGYFAYPVISNQINYNKAIKYYNSGDYAQALPLFEELAENGFKDSLDYQHKIVYDQALAAYNSGNFAGAIPLFSELAGDSYRDAEGYLADIFHQMLANIQNGVNIDEMLELNALFQKASYPASEYVPDYAEAFRLFSEGHYYDAYLLFDSIGGFEDASDRAQSCILPTPSSGVVYSNGASGSVDLKVVAPEWYDTYIKIYKDGELCRTMFIRKGESATSYSIPAGTYTMNVAYEGYDGFWFGPDDMFGDDGSYSKLLLNGTDYAAYLEGGYTYTLTLMSGGGEGTDVGSTDAGRDEI